MALKHEKDGFPGWLSLKWPIRLDNKVNSFQNELRDMEKDCNEMEVLGYTFNWACRSRTIFTLSSLVVKFSVPGID